MTSNKLYHHDTAVYNKEEFLQHYMELEQWAKDSSYTDIKGLEYSEEIKSLRDDLYFYRHVRNFIHGVLCDDLRLLQVSYNYSDSQHGCSIA